MLSAQISLLQWKETLTLMLHCYTGNYISRKTKIDIKNQKRVLILKQYTDNKSDFVFGNPYRN